MPGSICRDLLRAVFSPSCSSWQSFKVWHGQTLIRGRCASQVMALEAGKALQSNLAQDIRERGLNFAPDQEFLQLMVRAGADANVVAALKAAKVDTAGEVKPDKRLLQQLSDAAVLFNEKKYGEAGAKLSDALDTSFARNRDGLCYGGTDVTPAGKPFPP